MLGHFIVFNNISSDNMNNFFPKFYVKKLKCVYAAILKMVITEIITVHLTYKYLCLRVR